MNGENLMAATAVLVAVMSLMIGLSVGKGGQIWPSRLSRVRMARSGPASDGAARFSADSERPGRLRPTWTTVAGWVRGALELSRGASLDEDELEEGLYALGAAMEAGAGLIQALSMAAEQCPPRLATEFRRVVEEFGAGVPLPECLTRARARVAHPSFNSLCDTIDIQRFSGGDLRAGLASLAEIIRERRDLRQELKVKTAEARQSAIVLALIPPVIAALAWVMNPELMAPLWVYPGGRLGLAVGIGLWLLGGWSVARLTRVRDIEE